MYGQMTREELIEHLRLADEEIARLKDQNTRLADDYSQAVQDVDYWQGKLQDLENKEANEAYRQERSERRRLAEWNQWAVRSA